MDFGEVLQRAWQIVWKHRVMWIFGILASCSGGGGGGNSGFQFSQEELPPGLEQRFTNLPDWQIALIVGGILLLILLIAVVVIFLSTIGRIGLIQGTLQAEEGVETLTWSHLFNASLPYFWRVFGLNLLVGLVLGALALLGVVAAIFFSVITVGIGALCLVPLICLLVPLAWLIGVVIEQANIALVVEDTGILDALQRGWDVFRDNLGTMIVMGLILVLGAGVVSLIIAAPLFALLFPILIGTMEGSARGIGGGLLVSGLCLVVYLPVLLVLGGILRGFVGSAWSLTYLRLTGRSAGIAAETPLPEPS